MRCLAVDFETVPCLDMARRLWGIDPDAPDAFEQANAKRTEETEGKSDFQKPALHRIVAVGLVAMNLDTGTARVAAFAGPDEVEWIRQAHLYLKGKPTLLTWNGLGFDLPVLRYRALHHGIPLPYLYVGSRGYERYDYRFGDWHYDLMDLLSGFGRSTPLSLREMAALCDLPCKQAGSGDQVLGLWKAGDFSQIREYVREDAVVTARLFLRWWASTGRALWEGLRELDEQLAGAPATLVAA